MHIALLPAFSNVFLLCKLPDRFVESINFFSPANRNIDVTLGRAVINIGVLILSKEVFGVSNDIMKGLCNIKNKADGKDDGENGTKPVEAIPAPEPGKHEQENNRKPSEKYDRSVA